MRFEPGDFETLVGYHSEIADKIAERANALLEEWLSEAPVVYSWEQKYWHPGQHRPKDEQTHRARLVQIEEIPRE